MARKMGFGERRVTFDWHNERPEGFGYKFKSKAEFKWASYLDLLRKSNEIVSWLYEPRKFEFKERHRKRGVYTPDFLVRSGPTIETLTHEWHEVKTSLTQKDIYRFKQFALDHGKLSGKTDYQRILLVITSRARKGKQLILLDNASKYVDDFIFAGPILRKLGL